MIKWTEKEIEKLKDATQSGLYETRRSLAESVYPNRTATSVIDKMDKMGLRMRTKQDAKNEYLQGSKSELRKIKEAKEEERKQLFIDAVRDVVYKGFNTPIDLVKPGKSKKECMEETAVLLWGDHHIGSEKLSAYQKRIEKLVSKTISITQNRLSGNYKIDKLKLCLLGDMATGEILFPGQNWEIEFGIADQLFKGGRVLAEAIQELSRYFEIEVNCVIGNHGRFSKFNSYSTNADYFLYKTLELSLLNNKRVTFNIPEDDFKLIVNIEGHNCMLFHGDAINMTFSIPFYGIMRKTKDWYMMNAEKLVNIKFFFSGHFHTSAMLTLNKSKMYMNGTLQPENMFSEKKVGSTPSWSQWLMMFTKDKHGVSSQWELEAE